ncbi:MAG: hypothetical protein HC927_09155, partial [Deltaproteobacteria bacterium]|nr:hypothetical protein [Deltaproteobacteria bacterium]
MSDSKSWRSNCVTFVARHRRTASRASAGGSGRCKAIQISAEASGHGRRASRPGRGCLAAPRRSSPLVRSRAHPPEEEEISTNVDLEEDEDDQVDEPRPPRSTHAEIDEEVFEPQRKRSIGPGLFAFLGVIIAVGVMFGVPSIRERARARWRPVPTRTAARMASWSRPARRPRSRRPSRR